MCERPNIPRIITVILDNLIPIVVHGNFTSLKQIIPELLIIQFLTSVTITLILYYHISPVNHFIVQPRAMDRWCLF